MSIDLKDQELISIFQLFFDELPDQYEIRNTSRGDTDFTEAVIAQWPSGEKVDFKLSDNDLTFPEKIEAWKRCAEEYRKLGYYCPAILSSKQGDFPIAAYKGHSCVVYAEELKCTCVVIEHLRKNRRNQIGDTEVLEFVFSA